MDAIRNFAIIAHIDHGKSTLADRLLELTHVVQAGKHKEQLLDQNPISRERGITIKLAPVRMLYVLNNEQYILNLIDTPGHVDFSYEVERTLACVEGAILLVDATQGIQAQTIAHTYKALEQNLTIIPAINKIDMPHAQVTETKHELGKFLGFRPEKICEISAKTGQGVAELLSNVVQTVPAPSHTLQIEGLRALIFDSYFDVYRGVIAFVRVFDGSLKKGDTVKLFATSMKFEVDEVGTFHPDLHSQDSLRAGEIGYVVTKLKDIHQVHVGDTILGAKNANASPVKGYRRVTPMVFSSMFPTDPDDFPDLKNSLEKLALNDSALQFEAISSKALGSGFRVGFLGLLHADVVRQRLEQEYHMSIILTSPTVEYRIAYSTKAVLHEEPITKVTIVTPAEYTGVVMKLCEESRGIFTHMDNETHVILEYDIPLAELISHFFDSLKSVTSGYASLQWEFKEYRPVDVQKLEILLNNEPVEEFSEFIVADRSYKYGRERVDKLKELIPRQQFEVKIQARYRGKIVASARVTPLRKDVTAKLYGGDRTRKDKLLSKQKKGKKLMKNIGSVEVPKDVFFKLFAR
ncbi:elongation factor 4 [Candidatus Roizmanbacteria bacterium RIFCSPLOWO2_02_FULL_43_10]|uniref:Elongation factor 4 n=2 Tax=Candidatus Roizmaniibacteriota TaxID=1752723 RepID=A0A1F7JUG5_9BACT|nr:MAG: elongation factor 4 [Candidatus Roizmanbacteria bacterium RIFCSPHIGHO2_02_FULL_43_11]OGK59236.1 MAG: elongation factor 4 [Candidatus Roizmanbacteria bacterium RIFCSPLOWO2_02_FULL_43_10]